MICGQTAAPGVLAREAKSGALVTVGSALNGPKVERLTKSEHVVEAGRDGDQHLPSEGTTLESGWLTKDGSDTSGSSDGPSEQGETDDRGNDGFSEEPPPQLVDGDPDGR